MEVKEIGSLNDLPRNVPLELYEPPWFTEDEITEVTEQFTKKTGRPPKEIYRHEKRIYVR